MDKATLGQYGVYQVAAELCRRGYTAVTTSRNAKAVDVLAFNPSNGKTVGVQVKTGRQNGKTERKALITVVSATARDEIDRLQLLTPFVLVYVPDDEKSPSRFFVVPGYKVLQMLKDDLKRYIHRKHRKHPNMEVKTRWLFSVEKVEPYEDKWDNLGLGPV